MTDLIRSATLTHYADVARSVDLDPVAMLKKVGLPPECLEREDLRIPVKAVRRLLEVSATQSGVESFALRLADQGGIANLGPLALLIREQATIGTALEALARFIHVHNEGMRLTIERRRDVATLVVLIRGGALRQATELALGTIYRTIRALFGGNWRPIEVHLSHTAPRAVIYHRQFFGCDVVFDSEFDGIACSALDLDRRIPTAHPDLARYVESHVQAMSKEQQGWDDKIADLVRTLLPSGDCSIERIAERLACDRRTIHRRLSDCGTTFTDIIDKQRADLALRLIEDRSRPLTQIAEILGFSSQSAMARWFRGRFGCSVTEWRADPRERTRAVAGRW